MQKRHLKTVFLLVGLLFSALGSFAEKPGLAGQPREGWDFSQFERIPIQSGGRYKPMDSYAREMVLFLTGKRDYSRWNHVEFLLSIVAHPEYWRTIPLLKLGNKDVRRQLLLDENRKYFSPDELMKNSVVGQYYNEYASRANDQKAATVTEPGSKPDPREKELKDFLQRILLFHQTTQGVAFTVVPRPYPEAWLPLIAQGLNSDQTEVRDEYAHLIRAYYEGDQNRFEKSTNAVKNKVETLIPDWSEHDRKIEAEVFYNELRAFKKAWILYLLAGLCWGAVLALSGARRLSGRRVKWGWRVGWGLTGLAFFLHTLGFVLRTYISGRAPVTNMYESVIWVSYGVMIFAVMIYWRTKKPIVPATASFTTGLALISADLAPAVLDPSIQPLVAVLRSNFWLTTHVLTITISYAAFLLALALGNITLFHFFKSGKTHPKIVELNQLTYRAVQFGVVLVAAGTILGGIWADYSWGRFWGWDPKEVWALIVLLIYVAVLHGRLTGWVGPFGFAALSVVSFLSVLMAWYGVNFVLGTGMHSYGFSTGGMTTVTTFSIAELIWVLIVTLKVKWNFLRRRAT